MQGRGGCSNRRLLLVQSGELGAFQCQVVHQALLAEDEADHGILDVGGVNGLADANIHQRDRTGDSHFFKV